MASILRRCFAVLCLFLSAALVSAQSTPPVQADRIAAQPNLHATTRLKGHVPSWATSANDAGAVPPDTSLHLTFVLSRSPELQAAFTQLLVDQQNPASPRYHQWLTPQQVGTLYGPTQHDLDALTTWLTSQGLTVTEIAPSRVFVTVSAPASTVANALAISFHYFTLNNESRRAATTDPAIPSAIAAIVTSITGLADIPIRPMHHAQSMPMASTPQFSSDNPQLTTTNGNHYVTPGDFAAIFDLNPAYSAGINGAGQKVAIIGRSRVVSTDISEFETNTGLAVNLPNTIIPTAGVDPGVTGNGDEGEALLDVIRVIGTAPAVQADLVVSSTAGGFNGIYVAAQYEVQTLLDPVMNISFGSCEAYAGASGVSVWDTLFSQAASEGISVFVSAADSGAATCDTQFGTPSGYQFRSINYICSSSYATCVGATEFADTANPSAYWTSGNSTSRVSAIGYIPEGAWNEPTVTNSTTGVVSYVAASGGGGASIYVAKPSWQTGTGVPADSARDVPDVSFPGAGHDGYYACYASAGGDCSKNYFEYFSGTSAAAPGMAGVTALLNQKTGTSQGNLNPLLYRVAAKSPAAFHDATPASSGVINCDINTSSMCNNSVPSSTGLTGGLAGYALTTGYDQATGLGSLDVNNFLTAAAQASTPLAPTKLIVTGSASSITDTQTVTFTTTLTSTTAGTPTGTVQFYANDSALGSPITVASGTAVTPALPFTAAGNYLITAVYSGDATYATTTAAGISLTVTGVSSTTGITASSSSIASGTTDTFTVTVASTGTGTGIPTGTVRVYASTSTSSGGGYIATMLLANGTATTPAITFTNAGSYTIAAYYLGDSVFSPSSSATGLTVTTSTVTSAYQLSVASPILSLAAGATTGNTDIINLGETGGFTGTVNLSCAVAYNGTATLNYIPTCSLANSSVAINAAAASTTLAVVTTVPHAIKGTNVAASLGGGGRISILFAACLLFLLPVRRLSWKMLSILFLLTTALSGFSGCSGGGSGTTSTPTSLVGTTTGSYTITVTATSAAAASNPSPVTIALTVN